MVLVKYFQTVCNGRCEHLIFFYFIRSFVDILYSTNEFIWIKMQLVGKKIGYIDKNSKKYYLFMTDLNALKQKWKYPK